MLQQHFEITQLMLVIVMQTKTGKLKGNATRVSHQAKHFFFARAVFGVPNAQVCAIWRKKSETTCTYVGTVCTRYQPTVLYGGNHLIRHL